MMLYPRKQYLPISIFHGVVLSVDLFQSHSYNPSANGFFFFFAVSKRSWVVLCVVSTVILSSEQAVGYFIAQYRGFSARGGPFLSFFSLIG